MDVMIPNLVCVLFDPVIPTSSFNLFNYFLYLCIRVYILDAAVLATVAGVLANMKS